MKLVINSKQLIVLKIESVKFGMKSALMGERNRNEETITFPFILFQSPNPQPLPVPFINPSRNFCAVTVI